MGATSVTRGTLGSSAAAFPSAVAAQSALPCSCARRAAVRYSSPRRPGLAFRLVAESEIEQRSRRRPRGRSSRQSVRRLWRCCRPPSAVAPRETAPRRPVKQRPRSPPRGIENAATVSVAPACPTLAELTVHPKCNLSPARVSGGRFLQASHQAARRRLVDGGACSPAKPSVVAPEPAASATGRSSSSASAAVQATRAAAGGRGWSSPPGRRRPPVSVDPPGEQQQPASPGRGSPEANGAPWSLRRRGTFERLGQRLDLFHHRREPICRMKGAGAGEPGVEGRASVASPIWLGRVTGPRPTSRSRLTQLSPLK